MKSGDIIKISHANWIATCDVAEVTAKAILVQFEVPSDTSPKPRRLGIWLPQGALCDLDTVHEADKSYHRAKLPQGFRFTGVQDYFFKRAAVQNA
jgi:hypothetical protein